MGRRRKQAYAFPSVNEPDVNASIDADIDGKKQNQPDSGKSSAEFKKEVDEKKEFAKIAKEIPQIFSPDQVSFVFTVYSVILSWILSAVFKCPFEIIYKELEVDEDVKLLWAKPLARILSKHAPREWAGMTAEIELIAIIGIYTATSFQKARSTYAKWKDEQQKTQQAKQRNTVTQSIPQVIPQRREAEVTV